MAAPLNIIVIGCGVIGLTTALVLREAGHRVRIWARDRPPHLTSSVAAAFWYPYRVSPERRVTPWARQSHRDFSELAALPDAGILAREALELFRVHGPAAPTWGAALPAHSPAPPDQLPAGFAAGVLFSSFVIETPRYLPWLSQRLLDAGGVIEPHTLRQLDHHRDDPCNSTDLLIDCAGLGARELARDPAVYPVRGQLVRVTNPGLERVILDESGPAITYIVPRSADVILGGSSDEGAEDTAPDPELGQAILRRCVEIEPRLRSAAVLGHLVGLRPCRPELRLELEHRPAGPPVIHNYGHGGAGVTLSWGCAREVAQLVAQLT
jgi:D-amino-acid oxidase